MSSSRAGTEPRAERQWDLISLPFTLRMLANVTFQHGAHLPGWAENCPHLSPKLTLSLWEGPQSSSLWT